MKDSGQIQVKSWKDRRSASRSSVFFFVASASIGLMTEGMRPQAFKPTCGKSRLPR